MGKTTISWTATSHGNGTILPGYTFNPWWGCTKVSPGCANCYAEAFDKRTGGDHFGPGKERRTFGDKHWKEPLRWNRAAGKTGVRAKVFCGSMCDWADPSAPGLERARLFDLIEDTPNLDWLLLTKRPDEFKAALSRLYRSHCPENLWLGVTVENRNQTYRVDLLREIPAAIRFLSCEPLLGPMGDLDLTDIHWVIVGGESGPHARPMNLLWAADIRSQCREAGVPFFFKQHGGRTSDKGGCLWDGQEIKEFPR